MGARVFIKLFCMTIIVGLGFVASGSGGMNANATALFRIAPESSSHVRTDIIKVRRGGRGGMGGASRGRGGGSFNRGGRGGSFHRGGGGKSRPIRPSTGNRPNAGQRPAQRPSKPINNRPNRPKPPAAGKPPRPKPPVAGKPPRPRPPVAGRPPRPPGYRPPAASWRPGWNRYPWGYWSPGVGWYIAGVGAMTAAALASSAYWYDGCIAQEATVCRKCWPDDATGADICTAEETCRTVYVCP